MSINLQMTLTNTNAISYQIRDSPSNPTSLYFSPHKRQIYVIICTYYYKPMISISTFPDSTSVKKCAHKNVTVLQNQGFFFRLISFTIGHTIFFQWGRSAERLRITSPDKNNNIKKSTKEHFILGLSKNFSSKSCYCSCFSHI